MATEIKFCGLTRAEDAREAVSLGAAYVGVIFAEGPRRLNVAQAAQVLDAVPSSVGRVGVFGDASPVAIAESVQRLGLRAVQLHMECDARVVGRVRDVFDGEIWSVLRIANGELPPVAETLFVTADAVLLDAKAAGKLGGTGVTLPWRKLREQLLALRGEGKAKLALAGGLRADNVAEAIRLLRPEIVDVSSGVEAAPGIKDHARMRAFRDAVHAST